MTTWAMIGSGNIGSTVARLALAAGTPSAMGTSPRWTMSTTTS